MSQRLKKELKKQNASNLKICVDIIRADIQELEKLVNSNYDELHLDRLKKQTDKLLHFTEQAPLENLANILQKNKLKRLKKKAKLKKFKSHLLDRNKFMNPTPTKNTIILQNSETPLKSPIYKALTEKQEELLQSKIHNRLLKRRDAQHYLRIFELLKTLHFLRGHNVENSKIFTVQFRNLQFSWSKVLEDNKLEYAQEQHVEKQWNEVFFGEALRSHYGSDKKIADFLRVRRIWDSFTTRSKHGTSIPCEWVLPPENATIEWAKYRTSKEL